MLSSIAKRLKSRAGESIAETLIALLISALALMMLAGAVSTAGSLITKSNAKMAEYYENDNALAELSPAVSGKTAKASIGSGLTGDLEKTVRYQTNGAFAGSPVIAYVLVP